MILPCSKIWDLKRSSELYARAALARNHALANVAAVCPLRHIRRVLASGKRDLRPPAFLAGPTPAQARAAFPLPRLLPGWLRSGDLAFSWREAAKPPMNGERARQKNTPLLRKH